MNTYDSDRVQNNRAVLVRGRINWGGILAGALAGLVTFAVLNIVGLAVGLGTIGGGANDFGALGIGAILWYIVSLAVSAFLGGLVCSRAAGFLTPAQGRFNGLLTGMVMLAIGTLYATNVIGRTINQTVGLVGSAVTTGANVAGAAASGVNNAGGLGGVLDNLGLSNQYQALVNGFNREELAQIIAEGSPELNQAQVSAAAATVEGVIRNAGRNIGDNLSDISNLGDVVNRQIQNVEQALTGPEFVTRLQRRGLSQAQAQEVATVVQQRVTEFRTQTEQTVAAVAERSEQVARDAAGLASRAAWIWLLAAGLLLGLATFGGGRGYDLEPDHTEHVTTTRTTNVDPNTR